MGQGECQVNVKMLNCYSRLSVSTVYPKNRSTSDYCTSNDTNNHWQLLSPMSLTTTVRLRLIVATEKTKYKPNNASAQLSKDSKCFSKWNGLHSELRIFLKPCHLRFFSRSDSLDSLFIRLLAVLESEVDLA